MLTLMLRVSIFKRGLESIEGMALSFEVEACSFLLSHPVKGTAKKFFQSVPDMRRFSPVEATRSMCWMMASSNIKSLRIGCFTWLYDLAIVLLMVDCFFVSMRRCYLPYSSQPCPGNWTCTGLCSVL